MIRRGTRSRSASPASSVDSTNRRRSTSKKKPSKSVKSKEDVQVFTSLPPKVEGEIKCYLKLQITKLNLLNEPPISDNKLLPNKKDKNLVKTKSDNIIARCVWWGEENTNGSIFRPRVLGSASQDAKKIQTTAKYMIRSGPKQFSAYLNDMKTLDIELIDANCMEIIAKVQMFEIAQLTASNPIKGFFPAYDSAQVKVAEVYISIQFESLKASDQSDASRPVTPSSTNNMNEFYTKYELFEKQQQQLNNKNSNLFNSSSYVNTFEDDTIQKETNKNPIISSLIERGLKLKQEMIKSSNTNLPFTNLNDISFYESPTKQQPIICSSTHKEHFEVSSPIKTNFMSFLNPKFNFNPDDENVDDLNDISRLSDPLHDPQLLSALIYDHPNDSTIKSLGFMPAIEPSLDQDQELKDLLEPPDLLDRYLNKKTNLNNKIPKPIKLNQNFSRSSVSSSDDDELDNSKNPVRVSFELQSSDGEGSVCNEKCIETLSPERISLLNLIQIAKLKIDKLGFFTNMPVTKLVDRINKIEQQQQAHLQSYQNSTKSTSSKSKPPIAIKKLDFGQLFFIEYQFPVVANTRDDQSILNSNNQLMATQVMRVISKRMKKPEENGANSVSDDIVVFEHNADYSVLFNTRLLESWWRSYVQFKIFFRPPVGNQNGSPFLIGSSRLSLRNVLKSKNFKLLKKLAVKDELCDSNDRKRIGTLHVSLELSSDLKEFAINLARLRNSEDCKFRQQPKIQVAERPLEIIKPINNVIEELSIPIQMFLSINEGRGFNASNLNDLTSIYLICRLFWNKEKVKFENQSSFNWTINLAFLIKPSIVENMRNNFMIIEAWKKSSNSSSSDCLIGTIKLPLHEFYLRTSDTASLKESLKDANKNPIIGVDGWISAFDLFTGQKVGEINVLLALGSSEQIMNLQKILFDKVRLRKSPTKPQESNKAKVKLTEHVFSFQIDSIKIHPVRTTTNRNVDETNFYVKYSFPSSAMENNQSIGSPKFGVHFISSRLNTSFSNRLEHKIVLANETDIQSELFKLFRNQKNLINLEVWSKQRIIARGELLLDKILSIINNKEANLNVNNRSFVVALQVPENETNDKYIGQLFLTVEYKNDLLINYSINVDQSISINQNQSIDSNIVWMNVGLLRANGLKNAISNIITANRSSLFSLENSNIYVKFSLNFLNRPHDFKQTRLISSSLSGYTPEFFDYFDIECPLVSKYNSNSKRTISLAEQLELGQIIFEVWSKFIDVYNKNSSDVLLGTCTVALEPLLENRIGVRGWIPIRSSMVGSSVLANIVDEQNIGSLEMTVRFTKTDDYLRIIQAAKEIGWVRASELQESTSNQICSFEQIPKIPNMPKLNLDYLNEPANEPRKRIKCLIEIEKAIHLPKVYDEKLNSHVDPNAFVTFSPSLENQSELVHTKICERKSSPLWNYQLAFQVDSDYFLQDGKYFILKVWHKYSLDDDEFVDFKISNKILGYVSVDLQPLICGLSHLSGWYNIQDSVGNCQGQLKINFLPQENLFPIKEMHLKRKKIQPVNSRVSCTSQLSIASVPTSTSSTMSFLNSSTASSAITSTNNFSISENSSKDPKELRMGLIEKLSELDLLNKKLKERLENKSNTTVAETKYEENLPTKNSNNRKIEIKECNFKLTEEQVASKPVVLNAELKKTEPAKEIVDQTEEMEEKIEDEEDLDQEIKKSNTLADSFWENSLKSDSKSEKSFNGGNLETVNSIDTDGVEHLPPIAPYENGKENEDLEDLEEQAQEPDKEDENIKKCQSENLNDTEFEQTFNSNASYEIVPNRTSENGSPAMDTYDFIENIIDCTKLDKEDDLNNYNNNESLYIAENPENKNYEEYDTNEDNENLTVIVPAELNKIDTDEKLESSQEKEEPEIQQVREKIEPKIPKNIDQEVTEKLTNLSAKIPNYFLPHEDLEKTMKRLHYNYVNITSNTKPETESETDTELDNKNFKIKVKSTTLLIQNQKMLKQDLSRINKIFHSKFN